MTTPTDPFFQDPLAALAVHLEDARGMEIEFDRELEPHQLALLKTMGVTPITRTRIHAVDCDMDDDCTCR